MDRGRCREAHSRIARFEVAAWASWLLTAVAGCTGTVSGTATSTELPVVCSGNYNAFFEAQTSETLTVALPEDIPCQATTVESLPTEGELWSGSDRIGPNDLPFNITMPLTYRSGGISPDATEPLPTGLARFRLGHSEGGLVDVWVSSVTDATPDHVGDPRLYQVKLGSGLYAPTAPPFETLSEEQVGSIYRDFALVYYYPLISGYIERLIREAGEVPAAGHQDQLAYFECLAFEVTGNPKHQARALGLFKGALRYHTEKGTISNPIAMLHAFGKLDAAGLITPEIQAATKAALVDYTQAMLERPEMDAQNRAIRQGAIAGGTNALFPGAEGHETRSSYVNETWAHVWPARQSAEDSKHYQMLYWLRLRDWMLLTDQAELLTDAKVVATFDNFRQRLAPSGLMPEYGDSVGSATEGENAVLMFESIGAANRRPEMTLAARQAFHWLTRHRDALWNHWGNPVRALAQTALEAELVARKHGVVDFGLTSDPLKSAVLDRPKVTPVYDGVPEGRFQVSASERMPDKLILRSGDDPDATMITVNLNPCWMGHGHCEALGISYATSRGATLLNSTPYLIRHQEFQNGFLFRPRGTDIVEGQWRHVVARSRNTAEGVELSLFVNGVTIATRSLGNRPATRASSELLLGRWFSSGLNGELDGVAFYRRALTDGEVLGIAAAGKDASVDALPDPNVFWNGTSLVDEAAAVELSVASGAPQITESGTFAFHDGEDSYHTSSPIFDVVSRAEQSENSEQENGSFTISAWVNLAGASSEHGYTQGFISNGPGGTGGFGVQLDQARRLAFVLDTAWHDKQVRSGDTVGWTGRQGTIRVKELQEFDGGVFAEISDSAYLGYDQTLTRKLLFLDEGWVWIRDVLVSNLVASTEAVEQSLLKVEMGPAFHVQDISGESGADWMRGGFRAHVSTALSQPQYLLQLPQPDVDTLFVFPSTTPTVEFVGIDHSQRVVSQPLLNDKKFRLWNRRETDLETGRPYVFDSILRPLPGTTSATPMMEAYEVLERGEYGTSVRLREGLTITMSDEPGEPSSVVIDLDTEQHRF